MKKREVDEFGEEHVRTRLDPQILVFNSEAEEYIAQHGRLFKIEQSNSGLRWILTIWTDYLDWRWDEKGWYVKTLKMDLEESIVLAKSIYPHEKFFIEDQTKIINPSPEQQAFDRWFESFDHDDKELTEKRRKELEYVVQR